MSNLGASVGWGVVVAGSLVAGALMAAGLRLPQRVAATVTAFGGGVLLAAVAVELVPEADELAGRWLTAAGLLAGMVLYVGADAWLTRDERMRETRRSVHAAMVGQPMPRSAVTAGSAPRGGPEAARGESIAAGIFVDGVPESIALGLTVAAGQIGVALLAGVLVGNLVESYGAAQPIIAAGRPRRFAVGLLAAIGAALGGATVLGGTVLADASPALIGGAEALAAGAVLAVVSISIIPYAFSQVSTMVAAAAVVGFIAGYLIS
jgi:ZIP family zinc transporter